jgi:RimJ/RimL family protein N-acetyltransferase
MGIEIAEEMRGRGIGTLALVAGAKYAFLQGAHRIEGSTAENNSGMRRAFEKAGWKFEGVLRALFLEDGVPQDYYSYSITKFD